MSRKSERAWLIAGAFLLLVAGVPVVQQVREILFWRQVDRFDELVVDNPVHFGGRVVQVDDDMPFTSVPPEHRQREEWGTALVRVDGRTVLGEERARVRPGLPTDDMGRYHLWINARVFADRETGREELWLGRRVQPRPTGAIYEILRVDEAGGLSVDTALVGDRADSFRLYRTMDILMPPSVTVYPYSLSNVWPSILVPFLFPWATFLVGLVAVMVGLFARSRRTRTSAASLDE